jgi:hypothetical protein
LCNILSGAVYAHARQYTFRIIERWDEAAFHRCPGKGLEHFSHYYAQYESATFSRMLGRRIIPVPMEDQGLVVDEGIARASDLLVGEIWLFCKLQDDAKNLMRVSMSQLNFSARAHHCILKLYGSLRVWLLLKKFKLHISRRLCSVG